MKQTLYQILGVEPDASFEDIGVAYAGRVQELSRTADHNALVMAGQAHEVLSDAHRRAVYDASLAAPPAQSIQVDEPERPALMSSRAGWIAVALVLVGVVIWWSNRGSPPTVPIDPVAQPASDAAEAEADGEQLLTAPLEPGIAEVISPPVAATPATEQATAEPIVGDWSCFDPVSGATHRYSFKADGRLDIEAAGSPAASYRYEVSGGELTIAGGDAPGRMTIEQISAGRMVLNTGAEGRRLACTR